MTFLFAVVGSTAEAGPAACAWDRFRWSGAPPPSRGFTPRRRGLRARAGRRRFRPGRGRPSRRRGRRRPPSRPSGAVVAFDTDCHEEGWRHYRLGAGRFLLGTGTNRKLHEEGGSETHTLTVPEIPNQSHDKDKQLLLVKFTGDYTAPGLDDRGHNEMTIRHEISPVAMEGGNQHRNMPPNLVVNYCVKK